MTAAKLDPRTETYHDVKGLIETLVTKFHRRCGGDREELVAIANVGYCKAYNDYNPALGAFTTAVWTYVWRELQGSLRHTMKHRLCRTGTAIALEEAPDRVDDDFDQVSFAESLGEDARVVLWLIFDPPQDLQATADAKGGHPLNLKSTVKQYLHDIGWGAKRIVESFTEVADVLADL